MPPRRETPEAFYRFCPRCGGDLALADRHGRRRLTCVSCRFVFFQNPAAATGALILNDRGEVLLVERGIAPRKGTWDVPGGFVNWGEDPERSIVRELAEELHVVFRPSALVGGIHDWYDSQGLAVSVTILYYEGTIDGVPQPDDDVSAFRWFPLDAIPENLSFRHVRRAIDELRRRRDRAAPSPSPGSP